MFASEGCAVILPALFPVIVFHCPLCERLQYLTSVQKKKQKEKVKTKNVLNYPPPKRFQLEEMSSAGPRLTDCFRFKLKLALQVTH